MATLAERIISGAQQNVQESTPDIAGAINQGSQIAARMEQAQAARKKLEVQKQQMQLQKINSMANAIFKMDKIKDPTTQRLFQNNFLPKQAQALGLEIEPDQLKFLTTPENRVKLSAIKAQAERGEIGAEELTAFVSDPTALVDYEIPPDLRAQAAGVAAEGISKRLGRESQEKARGLQGEKFEFAKQKEKRDRLVQVKKGFDSTIKKERERMTAADNALSLLNSGKPISEEVVKTQLARLAGEVGNLTENDISRFGGSKDLISRGKQFFTTLSTGKLTPENKKQLIEITNEFRNVVSKKIELEGKRSAKGAEQLGLTPKEVSGFLDVPSVTAKASKNTKPKSSNLLKGKTLEQFKALSKGQQDAVARRLGLSLDEVIKQLGAK